MHAPTCLNLAIPIFDSTALPQVSQDSSKAPHIAQLAKPALDMRGCPHAHHVQLPHVLLVLHQREEGRHHREPAEARAGMDQARDGDMGERGLYNAKAPERAYTYT